MKSKKIMIILITAIFLASIAGVCAADANDTLVASENTNQIELSQIEEIITTDESQKTIQTNDTETLSVSDNDEIASVENDLEVLSNNPGTYSDLAREFEGLAPGGNITLQHDYYTYDNYGSTISISAANSVIDGNGAVIDMDTSTIRAFEVKASGVTIKNLTIKNAKFNGDGGAIYFNNDAISGTVTNCNFTNNQATGTNSWGGAICFWSTGNVSNCNFTANTANKYGGAICFRSTGNVSNCNFTNNKATGDDSYGGAVYFNREGTVTNCNFTANTANKYGGAVYFNREGTVTNCNFAGNTATWGGAVYFDEDDGTVTNCNFADNSASRGGAILSVQYLGVTADTCIFKTDSDTTFNTNNLQPTLNVDNFTTFYGSGEKLTFNLTTDSGMPVNNGNISISVYFKDNNSWVGNYSGLSGEGWAISLPVGSYYANFTTEYEGFQAISRTITITIPNVRYSINVTSLATNNKTVNITAKSDIPKDILWNGKLLFILPNGNEINATYAASGIWWAVHTFDDYADYQVNASYIGLSNVTINNATISITRANSTVELSDIVLNYGEAKNVTVTAEGATSITAKIDDVNATVDGYTIMIPVLNAGTYTLTVTTIADADHNPVTRNATITVNKAKTQLTADEVITTYNSNKDLVITLKDSNGNPIGGLNITVDLNGTKNYTTDTNGQVKISTKGLAANIYDVGISFNGTDKYLNCSNTTKVSIYKESSRVDTKPLTTDYNVHKYLVVGLKDNEGNPIRNADAFIEIHGVTYKCRSDDAGDARLIIRLNPGTYTAKITFDNVNYTGFTQYVTVIVKKLTPKLTAKKKTFKKAKKVKKYTVTLKDNNGKAMAKVKLTLKVKGKTYKAKTNAKGKATFKIKNLKKKGKYRATVKFAGNTYYNKVTKKVKITVK